MIEPISAAAIVGFGLIALILVFLLFREIHSPQPPTPVRPVRVYTPPGPKDPPYIPPDPAQPPRSTVYRYTRETLPNQASRPTPTPARSAAPRPTNPPPLSPPSHRLRVELVRLLQGDSGAADRLVKLEQNKAPGLTTDQYYQRAIDRLVRDRR